MTRRRNHLATILALAGLTACGGGGSGDDATDAGDTSDTTEVDVAPDVEPEAEADAEPEADVEAEADARPDADVPCPDPDAGFDEDDPGVSIFVTLASVYMMGQPIGTLAGGVTPAAREEFDPPDPDDELPLDTCAVDVPVTPTPECTTDEDCFPEQRCLPETSSGGAPIEGSERCVTPTEPMDIGPITVSGFGGGPIELNFNPGQNGAYTPPGDGTIDAELILPDTDYRITGDGSTEHGVGPLEGDLHVPPIFAVTSPEPVTSPMGLPEFEVDPAVDLELEWSGAGGADSEVNISIAGPNGSLTCRARNDGAFTIPGAMIAEIRLGSFSFFNILNIEQRFGGRLCGEGVTVTDVTFTQAVMYNLKLVTPPTP